MLKEDGGINGLLPLELNEGSRSERRVGSDGNALLLGELDERLLDEVGVVLYKRASVRISLYFARF